MLFNSDYNNNLISIEQSNNIFSLLVLRKNDHTLPPSDANDDILPILLSRVRRVNPPHRYTRDINLATRNLRYMMNMNISIHTESI